MLKRLYSSFLVTALLLGAASFASARPAGRDLLAQLPASDFVAAADLQRLQSETLPAFGALNAKILADINRETDKLQRETGIDPRVFDSLAVGVNMSAKGPAQFVLLLQGRFNAADVIENGFAKAREKDKKVQREARQYEGFTLWVIKSGRARKAESEQEAVAALDSNTLVFGDLATVRRAVDVRLGRGKRVAEELVSLATRVPALVSFAGDVPPEALAGLGGKDAEPFADLAGSIRRVAGALNANGLNVDGQLSLFAESAGKASELASALNGFKLLLGGLNLGGAKRKNADESFRRLLNSLQVTSQNNEVQVRLSVPENDVRQLMGAF